MDKKAKLQTDIERSVHKYLETIKELSVDSTILYIQRNNIPVDRDSMNKTIEVFKNSLESQQMQQLDAFMRNIEKSLNDLLKDVD